MGNHYDSCREDPRVPAKKAEPNVTWLPGSLTRGVALNTFFELKQLADGESEETDVWVLQVAGRHPYFHRMPLEQARASITRILEKLPQGYHCVVLHELDPIDRDQVLLRVLLDPSGGYCGASGPKPAWMRVGGCPQILWLSHRNNRTIPYVAKVLQRYTEVHDISEITPSVHLEWGAMLTYNTSVVSLGTFTKQVASDLVRKVVLQGPNCKYMVSHQNTEVEGKVELGVCQLRDVSSNDAAITADPPEWFEGLITY